ncbi:MAG: hypothetical protein NUV74_10915 [Candidatus Brocadiaceae bacterium]|nr:hypothetical protein [Candidatus Brocadiaceae bacterium]
MPLHIVTEAFSTIDVFKKLNCYHIRYFNYDVSWLLEDAGVYPRRINEIVLGKRSVWADTVLRLACCFEICHGWFNLAD